jgi:ribosomal protein S18 acetylase RimI-like enzyme
MKDRHLLIFRYKSAGAFYDENIRAIPPGYEIRLWKPTWKNFIPPKKGPKYFAYWIFHMVGVFRNRNYCALSVHDQSRIVSSLLVVPAHFKWPFMGKDDLQITYVMTDQQYRGQGIGKAAIKFSMLSCQGKTMWYVTDEDNYPSVNLCKQTGFHFYAHGLKYSLLGIVSATSAH